MRTIVGCLLIALGFWAGHAYSSYHVEEEMLPVLQKAQALHIASFMVQSADLVDSGDAATLRRKLLAVAESEIEPVPDLPTNWGAVLAPPFSDPGGSLNSLRSSNEEKAKKLRERIRRLAGEDASMPAG